MEQCKGQTKSGTKCKRDAGVSGFCHLHDPEKITERVASKKRKKLVEFFRPLRKFSERKGLRQTPSIIQIDSMNKELRNSLWNVLDMQFLSGYRKSFVIGTYSARFNGKDIDTFFSSFWFEFLKQPLQGIPEFTSQIVDLVWKNYERWEWFEVYDFLEYVINYFESPILVKKINYVLERELAGFRFVGGVFVEITDEQEVELLSDSVADSDFPTVSAHLERALELLSNRKSPDYRNSIKESISAVESMAKIIAGTPKAALGDALKELESQGELHPALRQSFLSLYGYTSNADGIRHAMLEEPNLSAADAKFFLLSCTSFINYLKSKI